MPVKTRSFEGNAADIARSKERSANKRIRHAALQEDDEESPEEAAFRAEQERLQQESDDIRDGVETEAEYGYPDELPFLDENEQERLADAADERDRKQAEIMKHRWV